GHKHSYKVWAQAFIQVSCSVPTQRQFISSQLYSPTIPHCRSSGARTRRDTPLLQAIADVPVGETCKDSNLLTGVALVIQPNDVILQRPRVVAGHAVTPPQCPDT